MQAPVEQLDVAQAEVLEDSMLTAKSLVDGKEGITITINQSMMYRNENTIIQENMGEYAEIFNKVGQNFYKVNLARCAVCELKNEGRL